MTGLHKEVYGEGAPIVMLHGWAMHTGVWRTFALALAEHRQVICIDLPGHGLSGSVTPYTLGSLADAVVAELPDQSCILVGWSLGGNIALRLAEKYPKCVKSLILITSNPHFVKTASWPGMNAQVLQQFAANIQQNTASTLLRFMGLQVRGHPEAKALLKKMRATVQECVSPMPEVLELGLQVLQNLDQRVALSNLDIPVQLIFGEQDSLVPVAVAESCRLLKPDLDVQQIAGTGHAPFITDQRQVLERMQEFILRHSG